MYKATIYKVNYDVVPNTIDIQKYDFKQNLVFQNGITIEKSPIVKNIPIYGFVGWNSLPKVGDRTIIFVDDDNLMYAFCWDYAFKKTNSSYNPILGNFETNNIIRFEDNNINVGNVLQDNNELGTTNINVIMKELMNLKAKVVQLEAELTTIKGNVNIEGNLVVSGTITSADTISGGISGMSHTHTSSQAGSPTSSPIKEE